eukprot:TRINITY_DN3523_c0_g1_i1.p1 TRINITY_DN3523_c0_g1~~TRINITY_DN3523_c0_g1_i1.p1  ORF type:complete len:144 (+),score=24.15 TRINITY_DN3523_c0_g1_i1:154-585(+)
MADFDFDAPGYPVFAPQEDWTLDLGTNTSDSSLPGTPNSNSDQGNGVFQSLDSTSIEHVHFDAMQLDAASSGSSSSSADDVTQTMQQHLDMEIELERGRQDDMAVCARPPSDKSFPVIHPQNLTATAHTHAYASPNQQPFRVK